MRNARRLAGPVVLATTVLGFSAAHAAAATVTVTGDDGNPAPLAQGAVGAVRNMSPTVGIGVTPDSGSFAMTVVGPDGVAVASPVTCLSSSTTRSLDYRGNGQYTITVTNYAKGDFSCKTATGTETYAFTINASVALGAPTGPFLIRAPNSFSTNTFALPVALNPGASSYDVQYAAGGVVGPDGAISGPSDTAFVDSSTGTADLRFSAPGVYTVVARATRGQYASPWSPPIQVQAIVPFDFTTVSFPDARGPSYRVRGTLREKAIRGKISIAIARGKKSGKYKSYGSTTISSQGTFAKRFTLSRSGTYRIRYTFKGSDIAAPGQIVQQVRVTRRVTFG